jgi:hypothetical protein
MMFWVFHERGNQKKSSVSKEGSNGRVCGNNDRACLSNGRVCGNNGRAWHSNGRVCGNNGRACLSNGRVCANKFVLTKER